MDGALVDLGVSSPQLDVAERGFSFSRPGPLDMRMSGEGETLAELLERADVRELTRILREYGEEPFARPIARAIRAAVEKHGAHSLDTARLAEVVAGAIPRKAWPRSIHPATRTFQALRIAVNDELGALAAWLEALPARARQGRPRRRHQLPLAGGPDGEAGLPVAHQGVHLPAGIPGVPLRLRPRVPPGHEEGGHGLRGRGGRATPAPAARSSARW